MIRRRVITTQPRSANATIGTCAPSTAIFIIGGGPAGAVAAILLARQGRQVTLIESRDDSTPKPCGGCLGGRAIHQLTTLGLDDLIPPPGRSPRSLQAVRLHPPHQRPTPLPLASPSALVSRAAFDARLRRAAVEAGATLRQPARARLVDPGTPHRPALLDVRGAHGPTTRHSAALVIAADGLNSRSARAVGLSGRDSGSAGRKLGFAIDLPPQVGRAAAIDLDPNVIEMFILPHGYLGVVQASDGWHLGGLMATSTRSHPHTRPRKWTSIAADRPRSPQAFLASAAEAHAALAPLGLGGAEPMQIPGVRGVGPMPCRPRNIVRGRVALVGDAAGYIEPFTGEGITWAIESAALLTRAIEEMIKPASTDSWNERSAKRYRTLHRAMIGRRWRRCRAVAGWLERPAAVALGMAIGQRSPWLAGRVARMMSAA